MGLAEMRLNGAAIAEVNALRARQEAHELEAQQAAGAEALRAAGVEVALAA